MDSPATPEIDPAARAFAELGQKVDLLEAAVTGLAAKRDTAPDYSETLGKMAALLEKMRVAINDFARAPAMQLTPDAMAAEIAAAGTTARASDGAAMEKARTQFDNAAYRIEQLAGTAATVREQRRRLLWAAGGSLFAGILLWAILPGAVARALPESWHIPERMAAHVAGGPTVWEAGVRIMRTGSPEAYRAITDAAEMRHQNRDTIHACEQAAAKSKRPVRCTVRIKPPQLSDR